MPDYWKLWLDRVEKIAGIPAGSLRADMRPAEIVLQRHAVAYVAYHRAKLRERGIGAMLHHECRGITYMVNSFRTKLTLNHCNRAQTLRAYRIAVRAWVWARAEVRCGAGA